MHFFFWLKRDTSGQQKIQKRTDDDHQVVEDYLANILSILAQKPVCLLKNMVKIALSKRILTVQVDQKNTGSPIKWLLLSADQLLLRDWLASFTPSQSPANLVVLYKPNTSLMRGCYFGVRTFLESAVITLQFYGSPQTSSTIVVLRREAKGSFFG